MSEKLDRLNKALNTLSKKYGKETLKFANTADEVELLETPFSTVNSLIKGLPRGKFTTIAGPQHTGKGAFTLQVIAHQMAKDPDFIVLWSDAENAFDYAWAEKLGVDLERLIIQKYTRDRDTMEALLDQAMDTIKTTSAIDMWVIDSIGALLPKRDVYDNKDKDKTLEGTKMLNLQVKLGEFFRKANILIAPTEDYKGCAVVCIGQINYSLGTLQSV